MNDLSWSFIKENIYYQDGSLRDIYVFNTNKGDWSKWIDLVNQKYRVEFYNGQTQQKSDSISKKEVFDYLDKKTDLINAATIWLGNIAVQCYFFSVDEIENDISPKEINSPDAHQEVINYLTTLSAALGKKVVLTAESDTSIIYIEADQKSISIL